jgi:hypothetical protein
MKQIRLELWVFLGLVVLLAAALLLPGGDDHLSEVSDAVLQMAPLLDAEMTRPR